MERPFIFYANPTARITDAAVINKIKAFSFLTVANISPFDNRKYGLIVSAWDVFEYKHSHAAILTNSPHGGTTSVVITHSTG